MKAIQKAIITENGAGNPYGFRTDSGDMFPTLFAMSVRRKNGQGDAAYSVQMQVSLDEVNWYTLMTVDESQQGAVQNFGNFIPAVAMRYLVSGLVLGTSQGVEITLVASS